MIKDKTKKISFETLKRNRRLREFVEVVPKNKLKKKDEILEIIY